MRVRFPTSKDEVRADGAVVNALFKAQTRDRYDTDEDVPRTLKRALRFILNRHQRTSEAEITMAEVRRRAEHWMATSAERSGRPHEWYDKSTPSGESSNSFSDTGDDDNLS